MIRLQLKNENHSVKDEYLALPGAQPLTLHRVSSENLPYACQCPLCGGLFEIPTGILYKIEEDNLEDKESGLNTIGPSGGNKPQGGGFLGEGTIEEEPAMEPAEPMEIPEG